MEKGAIGVAIQVRDCAHCGGSGKCGTGMTDYNACEVCIASAGLEKGKSYKGLVCSVCGGKGFVPIGLTPDVPAARSVIHIPWLYALIGAIGLVVLLATGIIVWQLALPGGRGDQSIATRETGIPGSMLPGQPTAVSAGSGLPTLVRAPAQSPQFQVIPLYAIVNNSMEVEYADFPFGSVTLGNVPFAIPRGIDKFTTQASDTPNYPTLASLTVKVTKPIRAFFLITAGDGYAEFANCALGNIDLIFEDGARVKTDLVLGQNIREWNGQEGKTVNTVIDPRTVQVWRSDKRVIDLITVEVPTGQQAKTLVAISFEDTSLENCKSISPGFNVLGVTLLGE